MMGKSFDEDNSLVGSHAESIGEGFVVQSLASLLIDARSPLCKPK